MKNYDEVQALLERIAESAALADGEGVNYTIGAGELGELKRAIDAACNEAFGNGYEQAWDDYWKSGTNDPTNHRNYSGE